MKVTYRDGTEEELAEEVVHFEVDEGMVLFQDKKRNHSLAIATDVIKKIE